MSEESSLPAKPGSPGGDHYDDEDRGTPADLKDVQLSEDDEEEDHNEQAESEKNQSEEPTTERPKSIPKATNDSPQETEGQPVPAAAPVDESVLEAVRAAEEANAAQKVKMEAHKAQIMQAKLGGTLTP